MSAGHIMLYGAAKICLKRHCDLKHNLAVPAKLCSIPLTANSWFMPRPSYGQSNTGESSWFGVPGIKGSAKPSFVGSSPTVAS